jgi:hypothetical protein
MSKEKAKQKRPRVIGIVILLVLWGLAGLNIAYSNSSATTSNLTTSQIYMIAAQSSFLLLTAILIFMYKRLGLYFAAAFIVLGFVRSALVLLGILGGGTNIFSLAIYTVIAYYLYKYLMIEPDKHFFMPLLSATPAPVVEPVKPKQYEDGGDESPKAHPKGRKTGKSYINWDAVKRTTEK